MQDKLKRLVFLLMLLFVTLLFLYLLKPFFGVVFWACVIGILFHPLYRRLHTRLGDRPNTAALVTLTVCVVIGVVPALFVLGSFCQKGIILYQRLQSGELDATVFLERIRLAYPVIQGVLDHLGVDLKAQLAGAAIATSRYVAQHAVQLGQGTLQFFASLCLMLYVAFFMLRDGSRLVGYLMRALPMDDERENLLVTKFAEVTRATVKGNLVVAAVQGTLGGMIFLVLGIPGALLWGMVMTLLSLIPVVGAGLIWVPVAIYLFAVGEWLQGLILAAFGAGVIGLVDNVLRPVLVGRDAKLPDYMVLLSTLGGFVLFGMNGFVVGPLIAALFVTFWQIFISDFNVPSGDVE